jgi:uncharacterized protein (TIGR03435 family)
MRRQIERTLLILLGIGVAVPVRSQTKPQKPSFEVVSVKPSPPNLNMMRGGGPRGDRLTLSSVPLRMLMNMAYRDSSQAFGLDGIVGGPDWMDSALFDVEAKADCSGGIISNDQQALMVQSMLEDRFQLKAHVETRDMPVYNLVVAKDGLKLKASADQTPPAPIALFGQLCGTVPAAPTALPSLPAPGADMTQFMSQLPRGSLITLMRPAGVMTLQGTAISVSTLVDRLTLHIGRQVIDKTGLTGLFDIAMKFTTDGLAPLPGTPAGTAPGLRGGPSSSLPSGPLGGPAVNGAPVAAEPVPTLFSAIQDLGLRLEQARGPVQVVVIDSVQKPSEN